MKKQFNTYLAPDLVFRLKHRAIDEQLSLSDLATQVFEAYLAARPPAPKEPAMTPPTIKLQPMVHVERMEPAIAFYEALGARLVQGSRDGDWALLEIGGAELSLLAHPPNPAQHEGQVELNFEAAEPLDELQARLEALGVAIARGAADEAFGAQLQLRTPDGMLVKVNQIDPGLVG